ncbi:MAG: PEP-CTERM system histidine kinase PrsK, partial [Gammaproteobacteria bacterium]
ASDSLAEAEKFSAFNRLSAYVVHDMKNSVAQLDLIVKNADRHKDNPEFIADSFMTVANVVDRMRRMLNQFKRMDMHKSEACRVDVNNVLRRIETKCADGKPQPRIHAPETPVYVYVEPDRFENVIAYGVKCAGCNER